MTCFSPLIILYQGTVLAIYPTTAGSYYSIRKNDMQAESLTRLVNSSDMCSDYQAHKLKDMPKTLNFELKFRFSFGRIDRIVCKCNVVLLPYYFFSFSSSTTSSIFLIYLAILFILSIFDCTSGLF